MHMMMRLVFHNHRDSPWLLTRSSGISTRNAVLSGMVDDITPIKKKQYGHEQATYLTVCVLKALPVILHGPHSR